MIENSRKLLDDSKKFEKIKKTNFIIRISMLGVFLLLIAISAMAIFASIKPHHIGIGGTGGSPLHNNEHNYVEINFFNLKNDNSTKIISAKDITAVYEGKEYTASYFSNDDGETKLEKYIVIQNGSDQSIKAYFEDIYFYYDEEYFYCDEQLKAEREYTTAGEVFAIVAVIEVLFFVFVFFTIDHFLKKRTDYKKGEKYKKINEKVFAEIESKNFNITKTFALSGKNSGATEAEKMLIFIDNKNKKYGFVDYEKNLLKIVDFKDLVNYKVIEQNGISVESQLNYSILLDAPYTTTSSKDVCKKLQLVFVLNDEDDSTVVYDIIKGGLALDSSKYKRISKEMIEITSFFDVVQSKIPKDKKFVYCKHCGVRNDAESSHCSACSSPLD